MKIKFETMADPVVRARLESLDFDPDIAERLVLELLSIASRVWINFIYDAMDGNRVVGYEIMPLPEASTKTGQA